MNSIINSTLGRASGALLLLLIVGSIIAPLTMTVGVWRGILPFIGILGIASLGQHLVVQQRGFDLSVAGTMSLTAVLISSQLEAATAGSSVLFAALLIIFVAACIGTLNGLFVSLLRVPPIVTTIGMNGFLLGFTLYFSGGVPSASPKALTAFTSLMVVGIPMPFILLAVVACLVAFAMNRTAIGRKFIAVGASPRAATALAIKVPLFEIGTYAVAAMLFSLAGLLLAGVIAAPAVHSGTPYMLTTLAAVVVGSNPLNGDRGSVFATVVGAIFLTYLNQLVLILGFDYSVQNIVQAVIVLAGVALPRAIARITAPKAPIRSDRGDATHSSTTDGRYRGVLHLEGVSKAFGATLAVDRVDLTIQPGRVHAIVGENGAGKSTAINLIAGVFPASAGSIFIDGKVVERPNPELMRKLGIAVAYQHPALPMHLSVIDCFRLVSDEFAGQQGVAKAAALLARVSGPSIQVDPQTDVQNLNIAQKHVCEIGRAIATNPRVLILDEPTEPFQEADVKKLFSTIRQLRDSGTAIVYISHRLHEVEEIADEISILRDGRLIETRSRQSITHDEIIEAIVGRSLDNVFPPKRPDGSSSSAVALSVSKLSGPRFADVTISVRTGEIIGLAGVEGQGQREFLRSLAGLSRIDTGTVEIAGRQASILSPMDARRAGVRFITDDRHLEGIFPSLSIRENIALGQLEVLSSGGVVSHTDERRLASGLRSDIKIKSSSIESAVRSLSGGNQQKVLLAREISAAPKVLLVDEPTKGVDVGSRSEIYNQLRRIADSGVAVVVSSSDGIELEGLCDRVAIFSRGQITKELSGNDVNDAAITEANLKSTASRASTTDIQSKSKRGVGALGLYAPAITLAIIALIFAALTASINPRFVSPHSIHIMLTFLSVLGFIAAGQLLTILIGEIDLSVGPMAGLVVVLASFLVPDGAPGFQIVLGCMVVLLVCAAIGALQGLAVFGLQLPAMVVTLSTFFAFQGVSLLLRPTPAGTVSETLGDFFSTSLFGIPASALLLLLAFVALELTSMKSGIGRAVRASGSDESSALRLGVNRRVIGVGVFAVSGLLVGIGGLILASEVGIGSATTGANYTLMSITAVVLGGAIIGGGRGSFIGVLIGAVLLQITQSSTSFLRLGAEWQNWEVGLATLGAAAIFELVRRR